MQEVNVTELRNHLPKHLNSVQHGAEILVTSHGKVIARILPPLDTRLEAKKALATLRKHSKIGDVVSPLDEEWDVENDHS